MERMSTKIDFKVYVKGKLNHQLATLLAVNDLERAQRVQRILLSDDHIHSGTFSLFEPYFEPITPKLMLAVQNLNNEIATGTSSPANFHKYTLAILAALQS